MLFARRMLLGVSVLLAVACGDSSVRFLVAPVDFEGGTANIRIELSGELNPATLQIWLDGAAVEPLFSPVTGGFAASIAVEPGRHLVVARAQRSSPPLRKLTALRFFDAPEPAPALVGSSPADGAANVPRSAWPTLTFAGPLPPGAETTFGLSCAGARVPLGLDLLADGRLVVNPEPALPAGAACALAWSGPGGPTAISFTTAAAGAAVAVVHERAQDPTQNTRLSPVPDDYFLYDEPSSPTGKLIWMDVPARTPIIQALFAALTTDVNQLDGWSPLAPFVIEISAALDPATLPRTPAESLDPLASAGLFDLSPGPGLGQRVPFRMDVRDDTTLAPGGVVLRSRVLMVWPSVPLRAQGKYAFVLTRRAGVSPGRPLDPSAFFAAALAPAVPGETDPVAHTRSLVDPVIATLTGGAVHPPVPREDLALVLPITVRSTATLPDDLLAMRAQIHAEPPPALLGWLAQADTVANSKVAAVVRGTWAAPDWRARSGTFVPSNVTRDADGLPVKQTTRPVEFVLALPQAALDGPVPVVMHQHGNPGSQEEVLSTARRFMAAGGFATIGFTDILNREIATPLDPNGNPRTDEQRIELQVLNVFGSLFANGTLPDHWLETTAEQLAFLHFLSSLEDLDVLPLGAPDGVPDLDLSAPLAYHGISEGGNNGQALLPYAPELKSMALVVGGARLAETLVHQQAALFLVEVPSFIPGLFPIEVWTGVSLFQMDFDRQDRHNQLPFAFQTPIEVAGTTQKASVLVIEGLEDPLVPNHATDSTAFQLGLPHLAPVQRAVPFLEVAAGPLQANLGPETTGAYFQYVPVGIPGIPPTPGCAALPISSGGNGHFCPQSAPESQAQRIAFLTSALLGVPVIASPFP
jgi:hypothetical protein